MNSSSSIKPKQWQPALLLGSLIEAALAFALKNTRQLITLINHTASSIDSSENTLCISSKRLSTKRYLARHPDVHFNLQQITFRGEHKISESQLRDICDCYITLDVGQNILEQLEDKLTGLYRLSGYPFAEVYLSDCNYDSGIVSFDIVEGYIDQVIIKVQDKTLLPSIKPIAEELLTQSPINWPVFHQFQLQLTKLAAEHALELNFKASPLNKGAACAVISDRANTSTR